MCTFEISPVYTGNEGTYVALIVPRSILALYILHCTGFDKYGCEWSVCVSECKGGRVV